MKGLDDFSSTSYFPTLEVWACRKSENVATLSQTLSLPKHNGISPTNCVRTYLTRSSQRATDTVDTIIAKVACGRHPQKNDEELSPFEVTSHRSAQLTQNLGKNRLMPLSRQKSRIQQIIDEFICQAKERGLCSKTRPMMDLRPDLVGENPSSEARNSTPEKVITRYSLPQRSPSSTAYTDHLPGVYCEPCSPDLFDVTRTWTPSPCKYETTDACPPHSCHIASCTTPFVEKAASNPCEHVAPPYQVTQLSEATPVPQRHPLQSQHSGNPKITRSSLHGGTSPRSRSFSIGKPLFNPTKHRFQSVYSEYVSPVPRYTYDPKEENLSPSAILEDSHQGNDSSLRPKMKGGVHCVAMHAENQRPYQGFSSSPRYTHSVEEILPKPQVHCPCCRFNAQYPYAPEGSQRFLWKNSISLRGDERRTNECRLDNHTTQWTTRHVPQWQNSFQKSALRTRINLEGYLSPPMHGLQEGLLMCDRQPEHNHFSHKHEVPPFGNSDTPQRLQGFGCSKRTADANAGFGVLHAEGIMRSTGYEPYRKRNFSEFEDGQEVDGTTFTKMKVPCVIEAPRNVGTEALNSKMQRSPKGVRDSRSEYISLETDHTQRTKATLAAQRKLAFASRVLCASTPCITPGWSDNYIPAHADSGSLSKDITRDTDWSEDGSDRKPPVQFHKQDYASHTLGEFFTREE